MLDAKSDYEFNEIVINHINVIHINLLTLSIDGIMCKQMMGIKRY